mmetsp:Transcript_21018/g.29670  ORF Transcript_21018/g.29670 Transcript_21018/m.29670 type:complete len:224 (-) Transcript_21018:268-939(-)
MPRFFDDYSNTYLTHDSAAGRKQQRRGWKFRENFKLHYQKYLEEWQRGPMGLASAQQAFIRSTSHNPAAASMIPPLPEGWEEHTDEGTRIKYYVHEADGKRQWHRPGFIPPPAGGGPPGMRGPPPGHRGGPPPPNNGGNRYGGPPQPRHGGGGPPPPPMNMNVPPPGHFVPPPSGGPPPPPTLGGAGPPPPPQFLAPPPPGQGPPPPGGLPGQGPPPSAGLGQ